MEIEAVTEMEVKMGIGGHEDRDRHEGGDGHDGEKMQRWGWRGR